MYIPEPTGTKVDKLEKTSLLIRREKLRYGLAFPSWKGYWHLALCCHASPRESLWNGHTVNEVRSVSNSPHRNAINCPSLVMSAQMVENGPVTVTQPPHFTVISISWRYVAVCFNYTRYTGDRTPAVCHLFTSVTRKSFQRGITLTLKTDLSELYFIPLYFIKYK